MKKNILLILIVMVGFFLLPGLSPGGTKPTIGFIYIGPVGDAGWSYAHERARLKFDKAHPEIATKAIANVAVKESVAVMESMIAGGAIGIVATSWDFGPAVLTLAKKYPHVHFFHCSGKEKKDNITTYFGRMYETCYLAGALAALSSKKGVIGFLGPKITPETIRHFNAYVLGARSVAPGIRVEANWTGEWYAPEESTIAAKNLIEKGVDVFFSNVDSAAPLQQAIDADIYAIGFNSDLGKFAPKNILTSSIWKWEIFYESILEDLLKGDLQGSDLWWGLDKNGVEMAPLSSAVPPNVVHRLKELTQSMKSGKISPFKGVVYDSMGRLRIRNGDVATDSELLSMDWTIYGVDANLTEPATPQDITKAYIVHSYEDHYVNDVTQQKGIEAVLKETFGDKVVIKNYFMNTKTVHALPEKRKADAALVLASIERFEPDIVFVMDDNAFREVGLNLIGKPYPVVFSGMNAEPLQYNEIKPFIDADKKPIANITGVFETLFFKVSIHAIEEIIGKIHKLAIILDKSPTGVAVEAQVKKDMQDMEGYDSVYYRVDTIEEMKKIIQTINNDKSIDAVIPIVLSLKDESGEYVGSKNITEVYLTLSKKPEISATLQYTEIGLLGGASGDYRIMGQQAGKIGIKLLQGENIQDFPIVDAEYNVVYYNTARAKMLGLSIPYELISVARIINEMSVFANDEKK